MAKLVECVPNFSEGRDLSVISQITAVIEAVDGVTLKDVDPGADTNRTVVTFFGTPAGVQEAAYQAIARAAELIDMRGHSGAHPRMGATDVCPFVPVEGVSMEECCEIALATRDVLDSVGLRGWCKTSGSKGLQMYVPLNTSGVTHAGAADFALAVGQLLERQLPGRVTTVMAKAERPGKIFVDWSQNALHKTTIAPYSLRARPTATVSTPVTWDEVEGSAAGTLDLTFTASDVLERVELLGDVFAGVLTVEQQLPL